VVASERVIRPQLGEERHHHAPDQVPALRLAFLLEGVLKLFKRPAVIVLVPPTPGRPA
jgi:hypothetical protein